MILEVPTPDPALVDAVRARISGSDLGRLGELGAWLAGVQGSASPRPPQRARLVVVAGDHGVASLGVSVTPEGATAATAQAILDGTAPVAVLAREAGVGLRLHDVAIGRPSRLLDREDALTAEEVEAAFDGGRALVDAEVDSGTDLLLLGHIGRGAATATAVLIAALVGEEPVVAVGRPPALDDATWMRRTAAVRDGLRRVHRQTAQWEPLVLLAVAGGADMAALVGILVQAAFRRTPVLVDGPVVATCALVATQHAPGVEQWWQPADTCAAPAHGLVLTRLDKRPLLSLQLGDGAGASALLAAPLLTAAIQLLSSLPGAPEPVAAQPPAEPASDAVPNVQPDAEPDAEPAPAAAEEPAPTE